MLSFLLLGFVAGCASTGSTPRPKAPMDDPLQAVSAERLYRQGLTLARRRDAIRAEQYLQAARERGFPARVAILRLVEVCVANNRVRAALGHVLPYLREHPHDWPMRHLAAALELALKRPSRARKQLERVLAHEEHAPSHYLLGVVLAEAMAAPNAARDHFKRYLELAPQGRFAATSRSHLRQLDALPPNPSKGDLP